MGKKKEKTNFVHILKLHDSLMVNPLPPSSSSATHIHTKAPKRQGLHGCWPRVSLWTHQYKRMRSVPFSFLGKVHLFLPVLWLAFQPRQAERVTVSHLNPGLNEGKRRSSTVGSGSPAQQGLVSRRILRRPLSYQASVLLSLYHSCLSNKGEGGKEREEERKVTKDRGDLTR